MPKELSLTLNGLYCREIMDCEDDSYASSGEEWKPSEVASESDESFQLPKLSSTTSIYKKKKITRMGLATM